MSLDRHIDNVVAKGNRTLGFVRRNLKDCPPKVLLPEDCYVTCNGRLLNEGEPFEDGKVYHIVPRLVGGKGGFGSMLRAIGAQIEKTTNHEACRDISGRRLRDVNNEKKLKEWLGKKTEKDKEREREKQERRERRKALPNHKFEDEKYHEQRKKVAENQEDAILQGLQKVNKVAPTCTVTSETAGSSGIKRKTTGSDSGPTAKTKKTSEWLGIDIDDLSDFDSDEDSDSSSAQDKPSSINENSCDIDQSNDTKESCDMVIQSENSDSNSNGMDKIQKTDSETCSLEDNSKTAMETCENTEQTNGLLESLKNIPPKEKDTDAEIRKNDEDEDKPFNFDDYNSAVELQSLGLDKLKAELMARKLKCGGNLEQRADRLFSVKGLTEDQIPSSLLAKPSRKN